MAKKKTEDNNKLIAENRKARFAYAIGDTLEAGIMLTGSEVKSLRGGHFTRITSAIGSTKRNPMPQRRMASVSASALPTR